MRKAPAAKAYPKKPRKNKTGKNAAEYEDVLRGILVVNDCKFVLFLSGIGTGDRRERIRKELPFCICLVL